MAVSGHLPASMPINIFGQAVLMRQLKGRPPISDLFGVKGLKWLQGPELVRPVA